MQDPKTRIFLMIGGLFVGLGAIIILQAQSLGKLRIIFCDVGQGDAILVITPSGKQILVDGGPGARVIDCLSAKMPFWDRTIEFVENTHPQQDHLEGLVAVLARYKVRMIATTGVVNETQLFGEWQNALSSEGAKIYTPKAGDELILDSNRGSTPKIKVLWPTSEKIAEWVSEPPSDLNESSIVMRIDFGQVCAYLTGDIPKEILETVVDKPCQVLKVAHHGSKTGTNSLILEQVRPAIAVIQVGKNNRFGHPHKEVVDLLNSKGVKILRNDVLGTIEIDTDGKNLSIKK